MNIVRISECACEQDAAPSQVARRSDPEEPQGRKRHKYAESDDDEDEDKPTAVKSPRTEFSLVQRLERAPLSGTTGGSKR